MNKTKAERILSALSPELRVDFSDFDSKVEGLKKEMTSKIEAKTISEMNRQLDKLRKALDFTPLVESLKKIDGDLDAKVESVVAELNNKLDTKVVTAIKPVVSSQEAQKTILEDEIQGLKNDLATLRAQKDDIALIKRRLDALPNASEQINNAIAALNAEDETRDKEARDAVLKEVNGTIDALRKELTSRINNMPHGGNANRDIKVGGTSVLSPFTDINLKAGTNVTITVTKNQATKYTDISFAASASGGSTRSINSISGDTTAGGTSGTDYVYLCTGTLTLTLPDAVPNTSLYTVKNVGTGVVTIATTSAQTIDGSTTIVLPVQYTAVDLISDTVNWNLT